ncbi:MAG TPA: ABC transporter permease [Terriglobales bacterium]|nr:ABC transporter permease [Terriglobales bacterium]
MNLWLDFRFALRQLKKSFAFSMLAVATLALGIGATTAIFTLFDQILLRSLPVRDPQQLVMLKGHGSFTGHSSVYGGDVDQYFSYPMYRRLRDNNSVFSGMIAMFPSQVGVQWHNAPALANAELVSGNYFDMLGVKAAVGRVFVQSDEGAKGASPLAVLSFNYWRTRFGSDPTVINQALLINGKPYTIIGVSAPRFLSAIAGTAPDVFVPMNMKAQITPEWDDLENERSRWLNIAARLKDNETVQQAEAGLNPLWKALRSDELKSIHTTNETFRQEFVQKSYITLVDGSKGFSGIRDGFQAPLFILMGMVVLLALMATANVAGLLLVRAAGRIREMSVRYALGAGRGRIVQQLLSEGIVLGLLGGGCGVALAPLLSGVLIAAIFSDRRVVPFHASPDGRVLAFAFVLSVLVALLFSITPVLQFWKPTVGPALKQQALTATGGHTAFRRVTVAVQIGLSVILLLGAGLLIRTLHNLQNVDVGFVTDHLLTFSVEPGLAGYSQDQVAPLYQRITETLGALPGVKSVALTDNPDLANNDNTYNIIVPGAAADSEQNLHTVEWERVNPAYLSTLQQPLMLGRFVEKGDQPGTVPVAVVNETLAQKAFGSARDAIGRTFRVGRGGVELTVVGVAGDAKHRGIREQKEPTFYTSIYQEKEPNSVEFYLRTYQDPNSAMNMVRQSMHNLDSKIVLDQLRTMDDQIDSILLNERLLAMLASSFGLLAALMAAIGLYGVLAFSTMQRTREIGVRMALGAKRMDVAKMVMREVLWLAGIAVVVAAPIALSLSLTMRKQLYGVSPRDPLTLFAVVFTTAAVSCVAAFIPARRASSVDPMTALRYE